MASRLESAAMPGFSNSIALGRVMLFGLLIWGISLVVQRFRRLQQLKKLAAEHGCKPIYLAKNWLPFAIDRKFKIVTHKDNVIDDLLIRRFEDFGRYTYTDDSWDFPPIYTAEPAIIQTILASSFKDWGMETSRSIALKPWLGRGIFISDQSDKGNLWATARGVLRSGFANESIHDLPRTDSAIKDFIQVIGSAADGWTVADDLAPLIRRFALDVTTDFFCGGCINSQSIAFEATHPEASCDPKSESRKGLAELEKAFDVANPTMMVRVFLGRLSWLYNNKPFRDACATFSKFSQERVDRAITELRSKAHSDDSFDFVHHMVSQTTDKQLANDLVIQMLFAGIDTTSSTLSLAIFELARHREAWQRIRSELDAEDMLHGGPASITKAKLKKCTFLQNCVTETLRMYPPLAVNTRQALRDTILPAGGGEHGLDPLVVEKGTVVRYCVYAMHRRKDLFGDDALEWKPDRWIGRRHGWEYVPFNGGPRVCLGQKWALGSITYFLARLAQTFDDVELTAPLEPSISTRVQPFLTSSKGVPVRFHHA